MCSPLVQERIRRHIFCLPRTSCVETFLTYKLINILKHWRRGVKEWTVQHVLPFRFHPPPPQSSQRSYTSLISIIFLSNGNIIPLFFIFIFFLSLQITPCCPFYLLRPSTPHPTITILYLFFISSTFCLLFLSIIIIIITSLEHPDQIWQYLFLPAGNGRR